MLMRMVQLIVIMAINATSAVKPQIYIAKGNAPWYSDEHWRDKSHVVSVNMSVSGQATVTCKGVTDMNSMFDSCSKLTSINLSRFDASKVTDMSHILNGCSSLTTIDLSNFNTSNVNCMTDMFGNCSKLTTIKGIIDMKSCTNYGTIEKDNGIYIFDSRMFRNCPKLTGVKIRNPPAGFDGAGLSSSQYTIVS